MPHGSSIEFGVYLRRLRSDRRLSLEAAERIAKRCDEPVSSSYLSRLESGKTSPKLTKLATLARVYDVPLHALVERFEWSRRANGEDAEALAESLDAFLDRCAARQLAGEHVELLASVTRARALAPVWAEPEAARLEIALYETNALVQLGFFELAKLEAERRLAPVPENPGHERRFWALYVSCCHRLGRFALAEAGLRAYRTALDREALSTDSHVLRRARADGHVLRGNLYMERGDARGAVEHFLSAANEYAEAGASLGEARARASVGSAWVELRKFGAASDALLRARSLAVEGGFTKVQLVAALRMAALEHARGHHAACERWALEAKDLAQRIEHRAMRFAATWYLYAATRARGEAAVSTVYERSLRQWLPFADDRQPEVEAFRASLREPQETRS